MKQTIRRLFIFISVISSPIWLSHLIWILKPSLPLHVKVIDYTVPYDNYAEHNALFWGFASHKQHCSLAAKLGVKQCPPHWIHVYVMGLGSFLVSLYLAQGRAGLSFK